MSDEPFGVSPAFFALVGEITHEWATLEYLMNECIWRAAQLDDQLGACITSQIFSFNSRADTLTLLLKARNVSDRLIKEVNAFFSRSKKYADIRNRAAHDPVGAYLKTGKMSQLQITGNKVLVFELRDVTMEKVTEDRDKMNAYVDCFFELRDKIKSELDASPYIHLSKFPSITRGSHGDRD